MPIFHDPEQRKYYEKVEEKLQQANQAHLLRNWELLDEIHRKRLLNSFERMDVDRFNSYFANSSASGSRSSVQENVQDKMTPPADEDYVSRSELSEEEWLQFYNKG